MYDIALKGCVYLAIYGNELRSPTAREEDDPELVQARKGQDSFKVLNRREIVLSRSSRSSQLLCKQYLTRGQIWYGITIFRGFPNRKTEAYARISK